ncbi:MAG: hypothetical protein IT532_06910 [Burkholderiales bacterium]|nr:hypothetical protein [Burkholderiales bacterium]
MKSAVPLAKFSPPRLSGALMRERLFGELDRLRLQPGLWVWAPPGAGKSTLLASYVEARRLSCVWFEIDQGDRDFASFFHHLSLAAGTSSRRARSLPAFTGGCAADVYAFAREHFRKFFAQLPQPALIVFDNFEESNTPELASVLRCAVEQLPMHLNLAVLSRHAPPAQFAHLQACSRLGLLAPEALRLTVEESGALGVQVGLSHETGIRAHQEALGWAAGMRLLLEQVRRLGAIERAMDFDSLQSVFDLFAQQLFDRAPPRAQRILIDLALLPSPTLGMARALCQVAAVEDVLEHLAQRHLFVERRRITPNGQSEEWAYAFHGLFRAFLKQQLTRTRGADGIRELALRSATVLEQWGQQEDALALYLHAHQWKECVRLLASLAPRMLQHARVAPLVAWIGALPGELVERDAQLQYWMGWARAGIDPGGARAWLQRAHDLARDTGQLHCATQAAAAAIETVFLQYASFEPLLHWVDALRSAIEVQGPFRDADSELRALSAVFSGTLYLRADDESLDPLSRRIMALIPDSVNVNLKTSACTWLLSYASNLGKLDLAGQVLPLAESLLEDPLVLPMHEGVCGYFVGWTYVAAVDTVRAESVAARLDELGQQAGMLQLRRYPAMVRFWVQSIRRSVSGMQAAIADYEAAAQCVHPYDVSSLNMMRAITAMHERRAALGLQYAQVALAAYDQAGPPWHRLLARAVIVWASIELADIALAQRTLAEMRELGTRIRARLYDVFALQAEARLALGEACGQSEPALRRLFSSARRHGVGHPMCFLPGALPDQCAAALRHGIETGYVKSLVRTYRLSAPAADLERWPWPLRCRALGGFQIEVDDEPVTFAAKAPRKALALLKTIICLGGRDVRDHQLIDALWGEDEADGARAAFNVTLHRLRRLLGDAEAILVHEGCLTLNPERVWVDAFAYEHLLSSGAARTEGGRDEIERALALYRGPLLPADREESWSAAARERLRAKFIHHVARHARALEDAGRRDEAVALYVRGLDADGLSEVFYQGLMRCHRDAGRSAEALSLYHRFRQTLSVSLGINPSHETEALARSIGAPLARTA